MKEDQVTTKNQGEIWTQAPYYRWAVCGQRPPKLQVAWVSPSEGVKWRGVETFSVTEEEYLK